MFLVVPEPSSSQVDPFGPLPVDQFPPAPDWLFPVTMSIAAVVFAGFAGLLIMWSIARRKSAAEMARTRRTDWIDLNAFNPKHDPRRPKSPKVTRADRPKKPKGRGSTTAGPQ